LHGHAALSLLVHWLLHLNHLLPAGLQGQLEGLNWQVQQLPGD